MLFLNMCSEILYHFLSENGKKSFVRFKKLVWTKNFPAHFSANHCYYSKLEIRIAIIMPGCRDETTLYYVLMQVLLVLHQRSLILFFRNLQFWKNQIFQRKTFIQKRTFKKLSVFNSGHMKCFHLTLCRIEKYLLYKMTGSDHFQSFWKRNYK